MSFLLQQELEKLGIQLSQQALAQFETYYAMLIEWNQKMNLTAITDRGEVIEKHFFDSVSPAFFHNFAEEERVIDIGAGAGFPSLPLKILFPQLQVTIVDSLNKRITFLQQLTQTLGLTGTTFIHGRAEDVAQQQLYREKYSLVLARAVARLPVLLELCLPFAEVGGTFIALKGSNGEEEIKESPKAITTLGGKLERVESLQLPNEAAQRTLIWISKVKKTPKQYPRKAGTPNKSPLS